MPSPPPCARRLRECGRDAMRSAKLTAKDRIIRHVSTSPIIFVATVRRLLRAHEREVLKAAAERAASIFDKAAAGRWSDAIMYETAKHPARASAKQCERDAKELEMHAATIRAAILGGRKP